MFIELTDLMTNNLTTINVKYIKGFEPNAGITHIKFTENKSIAVNESYEQVKKLIKREVAAERGY